MGQYTVYVCDKCKKESRGPQFAGRMRVCFTYSVPNPLGQSWRTVHNFDEDLTMCEDCAKELVQIAQKVLKSIGADCIWGGAENVD